MSDLLLADEREAVASASRHLAQEGLVIGTAGNISARQGDLIAVTPTGADLATVTAEMVTVIGLDGDVVDGDLAPTSEVPLHTGIYAATNALAITHAHAMASTAVSCCLDELPPLHYSCLGLGGAPRTAPYATFGSQELAQNVIEALKGRNAAMMQNHGSVAYGSKMTEAVERLELLEWLAELYWRASSLGTPRVLTDKDFEAVIMQAISGGYGAVKKVDKGQK
jgi:L-fuculose-phosphate aldolase